ncbi:hypothetical protein [Pseudidiomarina mangrovi]|uniref:hypothetical protein n=1 Tax=Pseudidiomarina mangrovi TaxID=2487133 RepID=UPI000FCAE2AE|nr:hypothetical protein [Pseudidiomarina mangrovi]
MLWLILVFIFVIAIPVAIIAAKNQSVVMDVLAMHENLKRNHPDDALSQLGPHEFQRAFYIVKKKRGNKLLGRAFILWFLGLFISMIVASAFFTLDYDSLGVVVMIVLPLGFAWYGVKSARAKMPEIFEQMRTELRL